METKYVLIVNQFFRHLLYTCISPYFIFFSLLFLSSLSIIPLLYLSSHSTIPLLFISSSTISFLFYYSLTISFFSYHSFPLFHLHSNLPMLLSFHLGWNSLSNIIYLFLIFFHSSLPENYVPTKAHFSIRALSLTHLNFRLIFLSTTHSSSTFLLRALLLSLLL